MIKVEMVKENGVSEGAQVNITGKGSDILFEAMSACEGLSQVFADCKEDKRALTELACSVIRGELTNDEWQDRLHEITHEKLDVKKLLGDFADFLKGLANKDDDEEESLEC